jgi:hypothetical protein
LRNGFDSRYIDAAAKTGVRIEEFRERMRCTLIESDPESQADIRRRMALALAGPDERARESIKAKKNEPEWAEGTLFA